MGTEISHWEWVKLSETFCNHDQSRPLKFLESRNVRQCFKHLVRVNFEHVYPDPTCARLVTISRLQNEIQCGGTRS